MENLKVKVNNEVESKEVQELFFELGYMVVNNIDCEKGYVVASKNAESPINFDYWCDVKNTITNQQLKDMVVLKRNDPKDANYARQRDGKLYFVNSNKTRSYYMMDDEWTLTKWDEDQLHQQLKPIKEKEMQEFLVKQFDTWTLQLLDSDTEENSYRVAVPSGASVARGCDGFIEFYKNDFSMFFFSLNKIWRYTISNKSVLLQNIIWQRSETESLNDQYAEIEKVRQETIKVTNDELKHRVYKKDVSHLDSIDVYRVLELFNVQSHAVGHAIKKLLCSGGRGAKDEAQDIQEAIDSLVRYQEMKNEDE